MNLRARNQFKAALQQDTAGSLKQCVFNWAVDHYSKPFAKMMRERKRTAERRWTVSLARKTLVYVLNLKAIAHKRGYETNYYVLLMEEAKGE